jgi:hypothetical protein
MSITKKEIEDAVNEIFSQKLPPTERVCKIYILSTEDNIKMLNDIIKQVVTDPIKKETWKTHS